MRTVTLDLPEGAFSALRLSPEEFVGEMRLAAAIHWYSRGLISQGKGAEIAGIGRADFLEALYRAKVPACQETIEELEEELERGLQAHREHLAPDPAQQSGAS